MRRHILVARELQEPRGSQTPRRGPALCGVHTGHALQEVAEPWRSNRKTPGRHEHDEVLASDPREPAVAEHRLAPRRVGRQEDKQTDAGGEDVNRRRCIAIDFCLCAASVPRSSREEHFAEIWPDLRRYHMARLRVGRRHHLDELTAGDVAFRGSVVVFAHSAEVAKRGATWGLALHRHAEVHEPHVAALEEYILQGHVAVADAMAVEVVDGLQQLPSVALGPALREWAPACHLVEQLPAIGELRHQPDVSSVLEDAMRPQQEHRQVRLRGQVLQDADLGQRILLVGDGAAT
mmetsp:Transcript_62919/g.181007  ORF Transcript_62919/g.181007 Transcript_62919/m.181007 type:complete len:292 (+) Transcript_62919:313-1188(+)